jgi:hypothetical protein
MRRKFRLAALLVAVVAALPASAGALRDFDVSKAETWNDALAICDVTNFLMSKPDLGAQSIVATNPQVSNGVLHGPYYLPPSSFYSKAMKETFDTVARAGQATPAAYKEARYRYGHAMLEAYRGANPGDLAFLSDQMRLCYALAVNLRQQVRGAARR